MPATLPRRKIRHEPDDATCGCGTPKPHIGEDVTEKLDLQTGVFAVQRHICGNWVCKRCETVTQAPVAPHVIDKRLPTAGLLAQVLVAKYQWSYRTTQFNSIKVSIPPTQLSTRT